MTRRTLALLSMLLWACSEPPSPHSRPKEPPRAEAAKPTAPAPPRRLVPPPSSSPKGPGPLPASDQELGRRAAVYALLAGGDMAKNLPEAAADEGKTFAPNLAEAMTPTRGGPVPKVRITESAAEGGLPEPVVRRVLRSRMGEVRFCYIKRIKSEADGAGTLEFDLKIDAKGGVAALDVDANEVDASVAKCVKKRGKRWQFPTDETPTTATFTVSLAPK